VVGIWWRRGERGEKKRWKKRTRMLDWFFIWYNVRNLRVLRFR
jgi:hypothetical protein